MAIAQAYGAAGPLVGRTALVLDAADGLGFEAATALAEAGARVVLAGGDSRELDARFAGDDRFVIRPEAGAGPDSLIADAAVADILIHCGSPAGIDASSWSSAHAGEACLGELRRLAPSMAARRSGSIIAISSPRPCAGRGDGPPSTSGGSAAQSVSGLAAEMRPFGVRVNTLSATGVDCAPAIVFLSSDASLHVTGARLSVRAGWSSLEMLDADRTSAATPARGAVSQESVDVDAGLHAQPPLLPFPRRPHRPEATESIHERRRA